MPLSKPPSDLTSPSVTAGALLAGKYRVERTLGEGGMGLVLAATNEALRQRVAIKLLRTGALASESTLGRFEREARAAASLRSEHVARVVDVGKLEDGRPYMVMEYLEGEDLGSMIDRGAVLPVGVAVDYVLQACEAIAEAHAAGIIDRDLKPANLFLSLTVDGRPLVKVLDFGISKMEDAAEDMSLTRTTEIIGSPSYMSPEQLRASRGVDLRTDIWALGVILYELLTRKLPFQASTVTELVAVILTDPVPDVRVLRPDVPAALADAIARCLSKPREMRFESVAEVVRAVAPFAQTDDGTSTTERAERVARVAAGSGRLPPTTGSGSGSHLVLAPSGSHGTAPTGSVFAADTVAIDPPAATSPPLAVDRERARARPRWPVVVGAGVLVLAGVGIGAARYVRSAPVGAATSVSLEPPPVPLPVPLPLPLPEGRKDLPPLASADASDAEATPASSVTSVASALPTARLPKPRPPAGTDKRPIPAPVVSSTGTSARPPKPPAPDDLSNIGRR